MFEGLFATLNPKGGRGIMESLIFLVLVGGVLFLNYKGIEINPSLDFIIKAFVGYMVGYNATKKIKEGAKSE